MPGATYTKMLQESYEDTTYEAIKDSIVQQVLGLIDPEDVADVILFLLSDASRKITGREIYADAGYLDFSN